VRLLQFRLGGLVWARMGHFQGHFPNRGGCKNPCFYWVSLTCSTGWIELIFTHFFQQRGVRFSRENSHFHPSFPSFPPQPSFLSFPSQHPPRFSRHSRPSRNARYSPSCPHMPHMSHLPRKALTRAFRGLLEGLSVAVVTADAGEAWGSEARMLHR
jgi:hypothetical protein